MNALISSSGSRRGAVDQLVEEPRRQSQAPLGHEASEDLVRRLPAEGAMPAQVRDRALALLLGDPVFVEARQHASQLRLDRGRVLRAGERARGVGSGNDVAALLASRLRTCLRTRGAARRRAASRSGLRERDPRRGTRGAADRSTGASRARARDRPASAFESRRSAPSRATPAGVSGRSSGSETRRCGRDGRGQQPVGRAPRFLERQIPREADGAARAAGSTRRERRPGGRRRSRPAPASPTRAVEDRPRRTRLARPPGPCGTKRRSRSRATAIGTCLRARFSSARS